MNSLKGEKGKNRCFGNAHFKDGTPDNIPFEPPEPFFASLSLSLSPVFVAFKFSDGQKQTSSPNCSPVCLSLTFAPLISILSLFLLFLFVHFWFYFYFLPRFFPPLLFLFSIFSIFCPSLFFSLILSFFHVTTDEF